jgi:hypothetical protein
LRTRRNRADLDHAETHQRELAWHFGILVEPERLAGYPSNFLFITL